MNLADLAAFKSTHVVVLGDVMLDHYVEGNVLRVSEEAPVPILRVTNERHVAGGAANVAMNCAALGGRVTLIGVTGTDLHGQILSTLLSEQKYLEERLVRVGDRLTTVKTRYLGRRQQIIRVDREQTEIIAPSTEAAVMEQVKSALPSAGVLMISDYAKGMLTDRVLRDVIAMAAEANVPVLVDPKRADLSAYRGATLITPNRKELSQATGIDCLDDEGSARAAANAIASTGADILLTRSEMGMSYFRADQAPIHSAAHAREVFDVSGAGDTVIAAIGLGIAARIDMASSMQIANLAAGIVVGKQGTAVVNIDDLRHALAVSRASSETDVIVAHRTAVIEKVAGWKNDGLMVGFANGCFDLIHPGHIQLIAEAASACDRLIVALNSDASVRRLKGAQRPLQTEDARAQVMASIKGVSLVTLFEEDTPEMLIEAIRPHLIVKGADYAEDEVVGGAFVKSYGGRVMLIPLQAGHSTTRIANKVQASSS